MMRLMANQFGRGAASAKGGLLRAVQSGLLLVVLLLTACGEEYPQSTIHPHTDFAEVIHSLYVSVFWWTMLILAVVWVILAYVLVKFRAREGDPKPRQIRGHLGMEIGWTVGPALIVIAIAIPSIQGVFGTQRPVADDAMEIHVTGHQFWWEFHYPEHGVTTANELRLPVNRPVNLRLASTDVIHSFWVPLLGGKRDVNPVPAVREGREPSYNWLYFTAFETGSFLGQCAEYCGTAHAFMGKRIVVTGEDEFEAWIDRWRGGPEGAVEPGAAEDPQVQVPGDEPEAPQDAPEPTVVGDESPQVATGRDVFLNQSTCPACHAINRTSAQGAVGPDLTLFGTRTTLGAGMLENNLENLVRWIQDPQGIKPGAEMPGTAYDMEVPRGHGQVYRWPATGLSDEEVGAVAAYLLSLE